MSFDPSAGCIALGADHGGYALKQQLKGWLCQRGFRVEDCGTLSGARCDYPVVANKVARLVSGGRCARGIIIDGAGIGSAMVANKLPGVRAALCYDLSSARNSREHNDANVLTLGAGLIGGALAEQIVEVWLATSCHEERHLRRVGMIEQLTASGCACAPTTGAGAPDHTGAAASRWDTRSNFVLAGPGSCHDNAAAGSTRSRSTRRGSPRKKKASATKRASTFRAKSARRLSSPAPEPRNMDPLHNLPAADVQRVLARVAQLLSSGQQRGGQWCFGGVCINAAVARQWIDAGVGRLSNGLGNLTAVGDVAGYIDHTLLKPDATRAQIEMLCQEAREYVFASVCVNAYWVPLANQLLRGSRVAVCTVVGFPLGASMPEIKAHEARRAIRDGAREIDMVINIGALKGGDDSHVFRDIRAVVDACEDGRAICKVIIETALLNEEEKVRACVAARRARADFVKTSTGFASGGATASDVALMARVVRGARMGVKASGGVRNLSDLDKMVAAGATRIGASAGVKIVKEAGSS